MARKSARPAQSLGRQMGRGFEENLCRRRAGAKLAVAFRVEELWLFTLSFEHRAAVERAFGVVADERAIASCVVEPEELRIRFLAPKKTGAPQQVSRQPFADTGSLRSRALPAQRQQPAG